MTTRQPVADWPPMATGEFELIAKLAPFLSTGGGDVVVGHGDDAAVVAVGDRAVCLCVDVVVEGVHFRRDLSGLDDVGWKAVAVNVSDIAAMGAAPSVAVIGLCRPPWLGDTEVERLYTGMAEACERYGVRLVGGDTVAADALTLSVTVMGDADRDRIVRRSGARPGDRLVLVGSLGAAAAALAQVAAGHIPDPQLMAAHRRPSALPAAGRALAQGGATALIDVSDGLGADLGHLCTASAVVADVRWAALPVAEGVLAAAHQIGADPVSLVCGGGEDFALLAAVPPRHAEAVARSAALADGVRSAVIGEVRARQPGDRSVQVTLTMPDGATRDLGALGYDHFRQPPRR